MQRKAEIYRQAFEFNAGKPKLHFIINIKLTFYYSAIIRIIRIIQLNAPNKHVLNFAGTKI